MNIYESNLQIAKKNLQDCQQKTQNKLSCIDCEKLCECDIRNAFVKATYENMSQGASQDFNF
ncbi:MULTISPECIES: hypothetical protein [unclassified Campylobacter]|uniref:hypothetical protein n=1 Tax=unclassified Campylobacter TaxID=2593542 RepID=UPI001BD93CD0|nr:MULTISPECIES: hypothetical protein [unclassified Campylobacter]MBZ7976010.1 hypothetical protein [Campylobacter sp. RM12637]MBZ7977842.1 hypothetical protein [Campylobacter sp. RM12654]MBZ7979811.1 hypothetical protein [Campylobacter sp. RM12642]MBZ7982080.1 hypothetical protein [Campylobacter sp. RM12640]MBZ7983458.1 hypothetical protein [Campylobacter sp. RM12647]MBZ7988864.1 hypothetical protein [Campylobacter sp. RM12635]MBZ7991004.1 hypothetical protein [Campylobacter sp. RM9331]MBZ